MAREYTVLNSETGREITFDWEGDADPTDTDIEEVFSAAEQFKPPEPTATISSAPHVEFPRNAAYPGRAVGGAPTEEFPATPITPLPEEELKTAGIPTKEAGPMDAIKRIPKQIAASVQRGIGAGQAEAAKGYMVSTGFPEEAAKLTQASTQNMAKAEQLDPEWYKTEQAQKPVTAAGGLASAGVAGLAGLTKSFYSLPAAAAATALLPTNALNKGINYLFGENVLEDNLKVPDFLINNKLVQIPAQVEEQQIKRSKERFGEGDNALSLISQKKIGKTAEYLGQFALQNAPTTVGTGVLMFNGIPKMLTLGLMGATTAGASEVANKKRVDTGEISQLQSSLSSVLKGLAEAGGEAGGEYRVLEGLKDAFNKLSKTVGEDVAKETFGRTMKRVIKGFVNGAGQEAPAEAVTQMAQNLTDKLTGISNLSYEQIWSNAADAGIGTIIMGGAPGAVTGALESRNIREQQKNMPPPAAAPQQPRQPPASPERTQPPITIPPGGPTGVVQPKLTLEEYNALPQGPGKTAAFRQLSGLDQDRAVMQYKEEVPSAKRTGAETKEAGKKEGAVEREGGSLRVRDHAPQTRMETGAGEAVIETIEPLDENRIVGMVERLKAAGTAQERQAIIEGITGEEAKEVLRRAQGIPKADISKLSKEEVEEVSAYAKEGRPLGGRQHEGGVLPEVERKQRGIVLNKNEELDKLGPELEKQIDGIKYGGAQEGIARPDKAVQPTMTFRDEFTGSNVNVTKDGGIDELKKRIQEVRQADPEAVSKSIAAQVGGLAYVGKKKRIGQATGANRYETEDTYQYQTADGTAVTINPGDTVEKIKSYLESKGAKKLTNKKMPWEMSSKEFVDTFGSSGKTADIATLVDEGKVTDRQYEEYKRLLKYKSTDVLPRLDFVSENKMPKGSDIHLAIIENAINEGIKIPENVKKEYLSYLESEKEATKVEPPTITTPVKKEPAIAEPKNLLRPEVEFPKEKPIQKLQTRQLDTILNRYIKTGKPEGKTSTELHDNMTQLLDSAPIEDIADAVGITADEARTAAADIKANRDTDTAKLVRRTFAPNLLYGQSVEDVRKDIFEPRDASGKLMFAKKSTATEQLTPEEIKKYSTDPENVKDWRGHIVFHGTSKEAAEDIVKNGIDNEKSNKGYFGKGFYATSDEDLANKNYAEFQNEGNGDVVAIKISKNARILDLRNEKDSEVYKKSGLENDQWRDNYDELMVQHGIDGIFDRSFGGVVIYNPKVLTPVAKKSVLRFAQRRTLDRDSAEEYALKYGLKHDGIKSGERVFTDKKTGVQFRANTQQEISRALSDIRSGVAPAKTEDSAGKVRFAKRKEEQPHDKTLIALHNLNQNSIEFIDKIGGLPAPSLAVIKAGMPFDKYGDVTLIAKKEMIDPQFLKVYNADIYSGRSPTIEYDVYKKDENKFREKLWRARKKYEDTTGEFDIETSINRKDKDRFISGAKNDTAMKGMFLEENGVNISPVMKLKKPHPEWSISPELQEWYDGYDHERYNNASYDNPYKKEVREKYEVAIRKYYEKEFNKVKKHLPQDVINETINKAVEVQSSVYPQTVSQNIYEYRKNVQEIDKTKTTELIDSEIKKIGENKYIEWIKERANIFINPHLKIGRRKEAVTLENMTYATISGGVLGKEKNMVYGLGQARGSAAKRFSSINKMHEEEGRVVRKEESEKIYEENQKRFFNIADKAKNYYRYKSSGFDFSHLDSLSKAIGDYLKGPKTDLGMTAALRKNDYVGVGHGIVEELMELAKDIGESPTEYFEAKPERAIMLNEFAGAVIPKDASDNIRSILKKNGIEIIEYDSGKDGDREEKVKNFKPEQVRFAKKEKPSEKTPRLQTPDPRAESLIREVYKAAESKADPILTAIRFVDDPGPTQKAMQKIVEKVTKQKVHLIETDAQQLRKDLGFAIDGLSREGEIYIDVGTQRPLLWTAFHEFYHGLNRVHKAAILRAAKLTDAGMAKQLEEGREEFIADIIGEIASRQEFWDHLAAESPSRFKAIVQDLIDALNKIIIAMRKLVISDKSSKPEYEKYLKDSRAVRDALTEVLKAKNPTAETQKLAAAMKPEAVTIEDKTRFAEKADQTKTEAFKKWFAESKATDDRGRPLRVFHGTTAAITEFKKEKRGEFTGANSAQKAFFFSSSPSVSESYPASEGTRVAVARQNMPLAGGTIPKAEFNLEMAQAAEAFAEEDEGGWIGRVKAYSGFGDEYKYDADDQVYDNKEDALKAAEKEVADEITKAEKKLEDAWKKFEEDRAKNTPEGTSVLPVYLKIKNPLEYDFKGGDYTEKSFSELMDEAIEDGSDGVIMRNVKDAAEGEEVSDVYAVFEPTQIKSATGNIGTFDSDNPDIRFAKRTAKEDLPALYEEAKTFNKKKARREIVKEYGRKERAWKTTKWLIRTTSGRLMDISPTIRDQMQKHVNGVLLDTAKATRRVMPLLNALKAMPKEDYAVFDLAAKEADTEKINELAKKYGFTEALDAYRKTFNDIIKRLMLAGYDTGYLKDYFPRMSKDRDAYRNYIRGTPEWGDIDEAVREKEKKIGRSLTDEEQEEFLDLYIRGYGDRMNTAKPGNLKERRVTLIDNEMNSLLEDTMIAIPTYIERMIKKAARKELFDPEGKDTELEVNNIDDSIGEYVARLIRERKIDPRKQDELVGIMRSYFNFKPTEKTAAKLKNLGYMTTMGSGFSSMFSQMADAAFGFYTTGAGEIPAVAKAIFGKTNITIKDVGIEMVTGGEFRDPGKLAGAVDRLFKAVGIKYGDSLFKNAFIEANLKKYQRQARSGKIGKDFRNDLDSVFGDEADQVLDDLRNGVDSDNVKLLVLNQMSKFQPITLLQVPQAYLDAPRGRIAYALKTYQINQLNAIVDEALRGMRTATGQKDFRDAAIRLATLMAFLVACGIGTDAFKDFLFRRKANFGEYLTDNMLKLALISRYTTWKFRTDGVKNTLLNMVAPQISWIDYIGKDIVKAQKKLTTPGPSDFAWKDLQSIRVLPVVGQEFYWWAGGGKESVQRRAKFKALPNEFRREVRKQREIIKNFALAKDTENAEKYRQKLKEYIDEKGPEVKRYFEEELEKEYPGNFATIYRLQQSDKSIDKARAKIRLKKLTPGQERLYSKYREEQAVLAAK